MKKIFRLAVLLVGILALTACGKSNTRVLIGSTSVTGDTYENADLISRAISEEMDADFKVDPVGSGEIFKELEKAKDDGSTVAFFHDYTYLGYLYGSYEVDWLEKMQIGPTVAINAGTCLTVMDNNRFGIQDWDSLVAAAKENKIVVGIQEGSVSNFVSDGLRAYLVEEENVPAENVEFIALGSMGDQREALWAGTIDVFNGSYSTDYENTAEAGNTDEKTMMKIIALTGEDRLEGVDLPTLAELTGGKLFYDKEFFFVTKKGTDSEFITKLETAVKNAIDNDEEYNKRLADSYYQTNFKTLEESEEHFADKMEAAKQIIELNK